MKNLKLFIIPVAIFIGLGGCISYSSKKEETVVPAQSSYIDAQERISEYKN
ncbi:hypothetical protein SAMN05216302_100451 [Nitrosomonas aestuarii]|uniref:Uncharacterized protein n=1 Tax=Nitrosomonas aestuarii TaxID=52441 RepID=A0A1I3YL64_9PROT|nr:hypothetical protein [Nitrosomonas aestuarii]SFK32667.1 hypothetical protein SAMN05216302_100451 [Nitrosomonas aestuarii]